VKLKRVVKTSLVDAVVKQLRGTIERQKLSCGDPMPSEPELVRQLGVSRPVRRHMEAPCQWLSQTGAAQNDVTKTG